MKSYILPRSIGAALITFGIIILAGWLTNTIRIIELQPYFVPPLFNTALSFTFAGLTLILATQPKLNFLLRLVGIVLIIFPAIILSQDIFGWYLGIDQLFTHSETLDIAYVHPGRTPPGANIAFILSGIIAILLPKLERKTYFYVLQFLILIIFFISFVSLIGYLLRLDFVFTWYERTRMALHSAIGILALSIGYWLLWKQSRSYKEYYKKNELRRFLVLNSMILTLVAVISGLAGFAAIAQQLQKTVQKYFSNAANLNAVFKELFFQLQLNIPIVIVAILLGILLLYWQIVPLLQKIINSEKKLALANSLLQESESKQRSIINNMGDALIITDAHGNIEFLNPMAIKLFGYDPQEILGKNAALLIPENLREQYNQEFEIYSESDHENYSQKNNIRLRCMKKDKTTFPTQLITTKTRLNNRMVLICILRDITEQKKIDRLKNEFISTVSHELRTPLTSIRGSLGLLLNLENNLSQKSQTLLKIAEQNCERLIRLINDILDIEKIEAGKMEFLQTHVNLNKLIQECVSSNLSYAEKYNVTLQFNTHTSDIVIVSDADKLNQVLTNLISNAVKFSPNNSSVIVGLKLQHNFARITVTNTGKGIPKEFYSQIFKKFSQSDATASRKHAGTGLGLSICKEIIERLGGSIDFTSIENVATTFYFDLPLHADYPTQNSEYKEFYP